LGSNKKVPGVTERGMGGRQLSVMAVATGLVCGAFVMGCGGREGSSVAGGAASGRIAFVSERAGNPEVYVMNADGSGVRRLTRDPSDDFFPSWSPDREKIVFARARDQLDGEIYVMNADGTEPRLLARNPADDESPSWSPDGRKIAFYSDRDGDDEIYVMDADGSNVQRVTRNPANDEYPSWSPDGKKIAFTRITGDCLDTCNAEIYVMNADGGDERRLTRSSAYDADPDWSPDGKRIAFNSDRGENTEIYVMAAGGTNVRRLTRNREGLLGDSGPSWSPDGSRIVFRSDRAGDDSEIDVANSEGSGIRPLTVNQADECCPAW
jgi:Tol biopolymer transport system component